MDSISFRNMVLAKLSAARRHWPSSRLYLLYAPGYDDPLGIANPGQPPIRETAIIPWAADAGYEAQHYPRIIEFDCRRVAAYLLETDPALDDPLLEDTITQAYGELSAAATEPDGPEGTARCLCGWLVSPESARTLARRFSEASQRLNLSDKRRYWLRWHDPRLMALLWPGLSTAQKTALLGTQLVWIAQDAAGHWVEFSGAPHSEHAPEPLGDAPLVVAAPQWTASHQLGMVNQLIEAWRAQSPSPLPQDATQRVHRLVTLATAWGLDSWDLQVFVLTAVSLRQGCEAAPELKAAVAEAARHPGTLADQLDALPPQFWARTRQA